VVDGGGSHRSGIRLRGDGGGQRQERLGYRPGLPGRSRLPVLPRVEANELPRLREAPDYRHIRFTHVPKIINSPVPDKSRLPAHLAPMYDELIRQTRGRAGSPQFVLLVDGRAVDGGFGTQAYHRLLPTLSELVARKLGDL
jgi:hypothetical protein